MGEQPARSRAELRRAFGGPGAGAGAGRRAGAPLRARDEALRQRADGARARRPRHDLWIGRPRAAVENEDRGAAPRLARARPPDRGPRAREAPVARPRTARRVTILVVLSRRWRRN